MNNHKNAVEINRVTKTFGQHVAVDDLTLTVPTGSIYGFIGPNGSGKTTTIRMIMRIFHSDPGSGSIRVLGEESYEAANNRIGYLPEERGLYKKMKVRELLRFFAELKGCRNYKESIDHWLDRLQLTDWADKKVETLSKGMSQKIQFISAIIHQPELIILDEPFSGLDPVNMEVLRDAVLDLRRAGTTIIFSTHDMHVAERMCDSIFMIFKGKKVLDGSLSEIQNTYSKDTLRVKLEGDDTSELISDIDGVEKITHFGQFLELRINQQADTQSILTELMKLGHVTHFELSKPSLQDIFVRIAGPDAQNQTVANDQELVHA